MPVWRDIAVFLDATPVGEHIGRHAAMLAQRHKAHLVGVYGVSHESLHPAETHARGSRAMGEVMARQRHVDEEKVLAAARHFGDLVREHQIGSEFRIVWRNALGEDGILRALHRSEEQTAELQSLMRNSYAVFCLTKKTQYEDKDKSKTTT